MTNNFFEPQEVNLQVQPLPTYIDSDGVFKINTPMLATYNFDGLIPKYDGAINASNVKPGYLIQLDTGGQYYPVVSVESDDDVLESTGLVTINYIDDLGNTNSESYGETDEVNVIYENWDEKIVGSQGWGITSGGNAIFTNVAVRGDLEATTMDIGGPTGITYDGSTVIIGASVVVNAPITFNGVTQEQLNQTLIGYVADSQLTDNTTIISGGNIKTGTIQSAGFSTPTAPYKYDGSEFASNGMAIVLGGTNAGALIAKNFKINPNGDATFKGSITGAAIQTASGGPRIILSSPSSTNNIVFLTDSSNEGNFGRINTTPATSNLQLNFVSPMWAGGTAAQINLLSENDGTSKITLNATKIIPTSVIEGSITGNAGTVTNGVYTNGSYANPSWITSLAGSKITGNILGNANNITLFSINQNLSTGSNVTFNSISTLPNQGAGVGTHYLHWNSTGGVVTRSTSQASGSSRKLKTNIEVFNINPLWTASVSEIYTFKYKSDIEDLGDNAPTQVGIIIDDISHIPEIEPLIFEVNSASAIDYTKFGVLLIPTINYLLEKIDDLQNRVLQLESQLGG